MNFENKTTIETYDILECECPDGSKKQRHYNSRGKVRERDYKTPKPYKQSDDITMKKCSKCKADLIFVQTLNERIAITYEEV